MVSDWIDQFISLFGRFFSWLDSWEIVEGVSMLGILIVVIVASIITGTFLSAARK